MNQRQQQQLYFEQSGKNLIVGNIDDCPIPPEQLAITTGESPYVIEAFQSGLTAEVFRVRFEGKDYTLKKKRPEAKVKNLDGQLSFLNEVQRRSDLQKRKDCPDTTVDFECIVPTVYADYRLGIILSDWLEGDPVSAVSSSFLYQLFSTLSACEKVGLFEWDLCSGNLLIDSDQKLWLFDFGYMYPFDPLTELNSDGLNAPIFQFCERFETRFLSGWLVNHRGSHQESLAQFKNVKQEALNILLEQSRWLRKHNASKAVIQAKEAQIAKYQAALQDKESLENLFLLEMFRSHVLDIEDDLDGKSCTATTLKRVNTVLEMINEHYDLLKSQGALFYHNEGKTKSELIDDYQEKLALVEKYQLD
ncbi:serine threonine protein kinase [Vibrio sp. B1FLJ16]|uniref:AarF/UbiB family protein n=1 Tax=Vibrio sp. B1FLJ16 TaxID=2751178 RepID=UPI0015F6ACA3|nr:AarF/UbiB family protein [Vibrio sp. B1FLJ16]CAD7824212.1 serine threonine protein kinase [Vibrio sp. B1FLJ16]CAE6953928.1 serine threonine protein kinase [Vibrio sp. B1FLJ16]